MECCYNGWSLLRLVVINVDGCHYRLAVVVDGRHCGLPLWCLVVVTVGRGGGLTLWWLVVIIIGCRFRGKGLFRVGVIFVTLK